MSLGVSVCPSDVVFVVDMSGSICNNERVDTCDNWREVKNFVSDMVERMSPELINYARFGLVTFGNEGETEFGLNV